MESKSHVGAFVSRLLRRMALALSFLILAGGWTAPAAQANSLCVNQGGTGGCLGTIAAAIAAAGAGDSIHIAGAPHPYFERLTIDKSLSLIGDDPATTLIDGAAAGQVLRISGPIVVTLSNLSIRNGLAGPGDTTDKYGAGIHNMGATLTLNNVVVTDNHLNGGNTCCGGNGGGIYNNGGSLTLNHSLVSDNTTGTGANPGGSGGNGAGIYSLNGVATLNDSTVAGNFAGTGQSSGTTGGPGGSGAGIAALGGTLTINRSTISDNGAGNGGPGDPLGGQGGSGGGIESELSNVTLSDSTISFNGSGSGGFGNSANGFSGNGAGVDVVGGTNPILGYHTLTARTSTFSNNQTGRGLPNGQGGDGGGLYVSGHITATLSNVTLGFNTADNGQTGGAIANPSGAVTLKNSLLAKNSNANGPSEPHDCSGTLTSLGYNLITKPDCTIAMATGDEFFVGGNIITPLANNGGPTLTHGLPTFSPAIDAADNSTCSPTDQRGFARPVFGGVALRCDIGAFELYRFGARLPLTIR